tara:strand:- start:348 stop:713 length:366 start_codon:yes stop_codon:yes gene_type:complete
MWKDKKNMNETDRSKILGKMIGREGVGNQKKNYNRVLNVWCKNKGYSDPSLYGWAPEKIKRGDNTYELKLKKHNSVCNDIYCRMLYESESEWEQRKYNKYPIYRRGDGLELCAICVEKLIL